MFAGSDSGWVHMSTDAGFTWLSVEVSPRRIIALLTELPGWLLAASDTGLFRSSDKGATWKSGGLGDRQLFNIAGDGGTIYAATSTGFVFSTDAGSTWKTYPAVPGIPVSLAATPGSVYAATDSGLYRCGDGQQWVRIGPSKRVTQISKTGSATLFAVSQSDTGSTLFRSSDGGTSWSPVLEAPYAGLVVSMTPTGSTLLTTVYHWGKRGGSCDFLISGDLGESWKVNATRYDVSPSLVSLHPSGRMFMLVGAPGGG
jgi:hypothetical protein